MDFTVEELKALEEQKLIRDEAERALKCAKLAIENICIEAEYRRIADNLKRFATGFLPQFRAEINGIFFYISQMWWKFPRYPTFINNNLIFYRIFVYLENKKVATFFLHISKRIFYENSEKGFVLPLELIALGTYLMNVYYSKQEYVTSEHNIWPCLIKNPLFSP